MNKLAEIIKSEIRDSGPITFEKFMDLALYHPIYGYYSSGNVSIGRRGDFYTSPYVHSAFGEIIADFIIRSFSYINASVPTIAEIGAGNGTLARDILNSIESENPDIYIKLKYIFIDESKCLLKEARNHLENHADRVLFANDISDIERDSIDGIVISNELFDSIPFHRAVIENGRLREIYIELKDDNFTESTGEPSTNGIEKYVTNQCPELKEGQMMEINLGAGNALRNISGILKKGFLLTVDYGYLASELYNHSRIKGTYKCMRGHEINEDPYSAIGEQDITAHVDFSNLISVGEEVGLNKIIYTTQGQFLVDWGILDVVEKMSKNENNTDDKKIAAIKNLFLPGSMGNQFKVLIQEKNLGESVSDFYPESPLKISFDIV